MGRVLVDVDVNDSAVFVALLDDVVLDLVRPAGVIFSGRKKKKSSLKYRCAQSAEGEIKTEALWILRLWVEEVGQLKAVSGQGLRGKVQRLAWSWSRDSWWQKKNVRWTLIY